MGDYLMFYSWLSIVAFNSWHADACVALGIPYPGHNAASGDITEQAQWTTAYTEPVVVADDDVRAYVEDTVAILVPDGLGTPSEPPPAPDFP
jgi:hypothetical protein